ERESDPGRAETARVIGTAGGDIGRERATRHRGTACREIGDGPAGSAANERRQNAAGAVISPRGVIVLEGAGRDCQNPFVENGAALPHSAAGAAHCQIAVERTLDKCKPAASIEDAAATSIRPRPTDRLVG